MSMFTFPFVVLSHLLLEVSGQPCSTNGIQGLAGCECNILGACDVDGLKKNNLNLIEHLPEGMHLFGLVEGNSRNLAYLCERREVAILYDCNNRIPLYAATALNEDQLTGADSGGRPSVSFRASETTLHRYYQQKKGDYKHSKKRNVCYKSRLSNNDRVDTNWYQALIKSQTTPAGSYPCYNTEVHKGHVIASQYGRGDQLKKKATFVFTNTVPQFATFNTPVWRDAEMNLVKWGQNNCAWTGTWDVQMYIVAGAMPSSKYGPPRYFGADGFSDYKDNKYLVNVPRFMWTAACCTFQYKDPNTGSSRYGIKNTAYWRENDPGKQPCKKIRVDTLEKMLSWMTWRGEMIKIFPFSNNECSKSSNFVSL